MFYISTHKVVQLVNLNFQVLPYLPVTKGWQGRVSRVRVARYATVFDDRGIISLFIDIFDLVHISTGASLIRHIEQGLVLILQFLRLFLYFILSIAEPFDINITFTWTSNQLRLGIDRVKYIRFLTVLRLVPVLRVSYIIENNTISMGAAKYRILLLATISMVILEFLTSNP